MMQIGQDWDRVLAPLLDRERFRRLQVFLREEYVSQDVYPAAEQIFHAFRVTSYRNTRVVLLGQDPYHGPGQAHGMSFSVLPGIAKPPSLTNIFRELQDDVGIEPAEDGYLLRWAEQGVLLMNSVLTVRAGAPGSHAGQGWEEVTDAVIQTLGERERPLVFILWGAKAREKKKLISRAHHLVLEAPHPSPLSAYRGFFGSRHFSKTNDFLEKEGFCPVDWALQRV